jgi:hypothetical protein
MFVGRLNGLGPVRTIPSSGDPDVAPIGTAGRWQQSMYARREVQTRPNLRRLVSKLERIDRFESGPPAPSGLCGQPHFLDLRSDPFAGAPKI